MQNLCFSGAFKGAVWGVFEFQGGGGPIPRDPIPSKSMHATLFLRLPCHKKMFTAEIHENFFQKALVMSHDS